MITILPKPRKSQVTVFILLGLVLVLVVGFAFFAAERAGPGTVAAEGAGSLKLFVESCLKIATLDAMHEHGLDPGISTPLIEGYVTSHMPSCLNNFDTYREEGLEVIEGEMTVDATITGEALTIDLDYPVTLKDEDSVIQFESASYQFPRKVMTTLKPGAETVVTSQDKRILLIIPPGTEATLDGQPLERVGIEVLDREFDGNSNSVLAGMLAFAGIPHGAEFSKPVTLIHFYDDRDVPSTIPEENVRLGFWSETLGSWVGLPTTVDDEQNILTATTTHFSPYGAVLRCTEGDTTVFNMPVLIKEDCYPCEGWSTGTHPDEVGPLWIQSDDITQGQGIPVEEPSATQQVCVKKVVVTRDEAVNEASCEEEEGCTFSSYHCNCQKTYYSYGNAEFGRSAEVEITFADGGDSCIWTERGDTEPTIVTIDSTSAAEATPTGALVQWDAGGGTGTDILITALCESEDDTCVISLEDDPFQNSVLTFTLEGTNALEPVDACLQAGASVQFNGFGVEIEELDTGENAYYPCTEEQVEDQMLMPFIGGEADETTPSVCTCTDDDGDGTEVCQWTIGEQEEQASGTAAPPVIPVPAAGTVTSSDGATAESRRERDKCPEGDKEPQAYPTCPADFNSTYLGKRFTNKATIQDTRDKKFCDSYGDYPEMQSNDRMEYSPGTELYVMGSALRKGRCWLLVEAQECLDTGEMPDFYIDFGEAENWVPVTYPYAKCPADFLENYQNRMFVFSGESEDTRSKKFCDSYGDYPGMDYTEEWEFAPDTQLLVKDSAQRGSRCWLLVQAQSAIKAPEEKPEFYIEFENAESWTPAEGYAGCPPSGLGYSNTHTSCNFPGEYRCEEGGEGMMLSQICCGSGGTGNLYSKTCTEGCDEESGKCAEDI